MRLAFVTVLFTLLVVFLVTPASSADYLPGIGYATMLNGINLLSKDGQFRLINIQCTFLPDITNSQGYNPYNPINGGKLWAILSKSDGTELYRFDFYAEKLESPYWLLSSYVVKDVKTGSEVGAGWVDLSQTGSYVLDFYLESGKFYTYPFTVAKAGGDDPFSGGALYYLIGDWEKWGYLFYSGANPDQSLIFKVWLSNKGKAKETDHKIKIKIFNKAGGTLVCMSREGMTFTLKPEWVRYEFDMVFPEGVANYGEYFKARDLVNKDGNYVLKMWIDDALYGEWAFTIEGGKPKPAGRTLRGVADPLTFIEGGKDAFWYEKS